jgi:hypothetical protein
MLDFSEIANMRTLKTGGGICDLCRPTVVLIGVHIVQGFADDRLHSSFDSITPPVGFLCLGWYNPRHWSGKPGQHLAAAIARISEGYKHYHTGS